MNRRTFTWLLPVLPSLPLLLSLLAKRERGKSIKLTGLDPRFVEVQRIAASSRQLTLEQWMVHAAVIMSGYDLNDGFIEGGK